MKTIGVILIYEPVTPLVLLTCRISRDKNFILVRFFIYIYFTYNQMNNFTIDIAAESETLLSNSILQLYKQNEMLKIRENKSNEPRLTQKQNSKQLGCSDSAVKVYREDKQVDSPYKRNIYKMKTTKSNTSKSQTHKTSEINENSKNKMNDLKVALYQKIKVKNLSIIQFLEIL